MSHRLLLLAGVLGFVGVLAGTFGAHVFKARMTAEMLAVFETGVRYHLYHAIAILGVAALAAHRPGAGRLMAGAAWAFAVGILFFSGSLYVLALTEVKWLGAIAPIGGAGFMVGWALLAAAGWRGQMSQ